MSKIAPYLKLFLAIFYFKILEFVQVLFEAI
jgi:hypothetical protein